MREAPISTQHSAFSCRALGGVRHLLATLWEALREIFDEAAYARFLQRHQCASTPQAYADFLKDRDPGRKPRCC